MASLIKNGNSVMRSGKYKGYRYKDIPDEYFLLLYRKFSGNYALSKYIEDNIIYKEVKP